MRKTTKIKTATLLAALIILSISKALSQSEADSLTLNYIISEVVKNHPSIKQDEEALKRADAKIDLSKSTYYPNIDLSADYTRIGPVPSMEFAGMNFELSSYNIISSKISLVQNIYDFGKTDANIELANSNKEFSELSIEQTKQKLATMAIGNFFALNYLQSAISIKDEQLKTLEEHLIFIQKKKEAGTATDYEILSTKVRISAVENQKTDLLTYQKSQLAVLNSLLGAPVNSIRKVKDDLNENIKSLSDEEYLNEALNNRIEIKLLEKKTALSKLQYNIYDKENNPSFNFILSGGFANNYEPDLNQIRANFAAVIGLKLPLFDAYRSKNNLLSATASIEASKFETEAAKRNISNEVIESNTNVLSNLKKIDQSTLQASQAEEAFKLAKINFDAGGITNLELLDAETSLSESKLNLLKSKIDYIVSIYKLKISLGEKIY